MKQNRLLSARPVPCCLLPLVALAGLAHAQNQTINGDLTVTNGLEAGTTGTGGGMEFRLGGLMIAKGTFDYSPVLNSTDEGAGTRMLWHPRKAAFRAGRVTGTQWDEANIGANSTAFGSSNGASGSSSTAMGSYNSASGNASTAMGSATVASGGFSTAMGYYSQASGTASTAMGYSNLASGTTSTAMGQNSVASGSPSTAAGSGTVASGQSSTATGSYTLANAFASLAVGAYNIGGGNPTTWVSTDPLFEIGNGTWNNRSNAVTVFKDGNMDVQGAITCAPGGDIPMFGE